MKVAVVGGGILGLTLAYRLGRLGHQVEVLEAGAELGGLAQPQRFGSFVWDRFYHCILPQDAHLLALLGDLGLAGELRWRRTGTGYYSGGRFYSMSGNADFIRFPLVSMLDKARMGLTILHAMHTARPRELYSITAEAWLTRWCGRRAYAAFWQPLLKAKFGPYHDRVAAVFIWATLTRMQGARGGGGAREQLGYVRGGYSRILSAFREKLDRLGAKLRTSAPVTDIGPAAGNRVRVMWGGESSAEYDQLYFTAPTRLLRTIVDSSFLPIVERAERRHPTGDTYLGVVCLTITLRNALTPYYVLNIADDNVELTGLIEMTNLTERTAETDGKTLIYLPRYLDSSDGAFDGPDEPLVHSLLDRGVRRLFPHLQEGDILDRQLHRARFVQPLPLVRQAWGNAEQLAVEPPITVLNSSMLECATLNNNEVVALVDRFVAANRTALADIG